MTNSNRVSIGSYYNSSSVNIGADQSASAVIGDPSGILNISGEGSTSFTGSVSSTTPSGTLDISGEGSTSFTGSVSSVAGTDITLVVNTDLSSTLVAGESRFFDISGTTTNVSGARPWNDIYYNWDWDDAGNIFPSSIGPIVSKVFRDPGTYNLGCSATDASGNFDSSSWTLTVEDPDTVYSTTNTISISPDGDFTGAAIGSTHVTTESLATALSYVARGKRVEFKTGGKWGTSVGEGIDLTGGSGRPALITTFGTGSAPIFEISGTISSAFNMITLAGSRFSIVGFKFENNSGYFGSQVSPIAGGHTCSGVTVADCSASNFTVGTTWQPFGPDFYVEDNNQSITVNNCTFDPIKGVEIYLGFGGAKRFSIKGCTFGNADQHLVRFYIGDLWELAYNTFGSVAGTQHQVKAHADNSLSSFNGISRGWNSYHNHFNDSPEPWKFALGTQNSTSNELIRDIVCDGDYFNLASGLGGDENSGHVVFGSYDVTIRNAVYDGRGNPNNVTGNSIGKRGVEPSPSGFQSLNCTLWTSGSGSKAEMTVVGTYGTGTPVTKNHIVDAASYTTAVVSNGTIDGGGSLVGDAKFVDPGNQDFSLSSGSTAIDTGVAVYNVNSFNSDGLRRFLDTLPNAGAYEDAQGGPATLNGILNVSGEGSATFTANVSSIGSLDILGEGTTSLSGDVSATTASGVINLSGEGDVGFTGGLVLSSSLDLSGEGDVNFSPGIETSGLLVLSGEGSTTFTGILSGDSILAIGGEGSISASGDITPAVAGSLNVSGEGTLTSNGTVVGNPVIALSGEGSLTAQGTVDSTASLDISGFGLIHQEISKIGEYMPVDPPFSEIIESIIYGLPDDLGTYYTGIIREWLNDLERNATKVKSETIRETIKALQTIFSSKLLIIRIDGTEQLVDCIPGNQERVIAALRNVDRNLQLPITSIKFNGIDQIAERKKYKNLIVATSEWSEKEQRAIRIISFVPKQINIGLSLSIWSKYQDDLLQLTEQIEYLFRPDIQIITKFADNSKVFLNVDSNDSVEIIGDGEQRVLRRTFSLTCETYLHSPKFRITNTGEIEKFNSEIQIVEE